MENTAVTQTTSPEPIVSMGGDSPVSFDELESISALPGKVESQQAKKEAKKEKQDGELEHRDGKESDEDKVRDGKKAKEKDGQEKAREVEKEVKTVKNIKVKAGDQEIELAHDALVPVKVDGKLEQKSLQEVINGYSGQSSLDRKFAEFKKVQTQFNEERQQLERFVQDSHDLLVNKGDFRGFVEYVAEVMGADPKKVYQETVEKFQTTLEQYQSLSPEEREAAKLQDELEFYKKKDEALRERERMTREEKEYRSKVESVMETHGMDNATFVKRYDELVATGKFDPNEIEADDVARFHKSMQTVENIEGLIEAHAPELENKEEEIHRLMTLAIQNGATKEELEEIVKALYANQAERKLAKKINKLEKKARSETPVKSAGTDPTFFDELG